MLVDGALLELLEVAAVGMGAGGLARPLIESLTVDVVVRGTVRVEGPREIPDGEVLSG